MPLASMFFFTLASGSVFVLGDITTQKKRNKSVVNDHISANFLIELVYNYIMQYKNDDMINSEEGL